MVLIIVQNPYDTLVWGNNRRMMNALSRPPYHQTLHLMFLPFLCWHLLEIIKEWWILYHILHATKLFTSHAYFSYVGILLTLCIGCANLFFSAFLVFWKFAEHGKVLDEFFLSTAGNFIDTWHITRDCQNDHETFPAISFVLNIPLTCISGKFQTEIGKSWAAEVNARRKEGCGKQK